MVVVEEHRRDSYGPGDELGGWEAVTLGPEDSSVTESEIDLTSSTCDLFSSLEGGHEYRIRMKRQEAGWAYGTKEQVFGSQDCIFTTRMAEVSPLRLECEDELRLRVEG